MTAARAWLHEWWPILSAVVLATGGILLYLHGLEIRLNLVELQMGQQQAQAKRLLEARDGFLQRLAAVEEGSRRVEHDVDFLVRILTRSVKMPSQEAQSGGLP